MTDQSGWTTRTLAACGRLLSGGTPSKGSPDYWDGDIPWFSSKELKALELNDSELHVTRLGAENGSNLVPPGTVLFVVRGMSLAKEFRVGLTTVPATFNQDVKALIPSADVDGRYLARCLRWREPQVLASTEESSHGTKRLPAQVFENIEIPIPPLTEQRRIADILDKADAIRRKRKEAIALTDELLRSTFLDMFGNPEDTRKATGVPFADAPLEIIDGDRGKEYPPSDEFTPSGHCLFLSAKNVTSRGFDFSERQFIGAKRDAALSKGKLSRGDVVLTTRGTLGNSAHYSTGVSFDHVRINSGMLILRANGDALLPEFLYFYLRSPHFLNQIALAQSGSAQPQLPVRTLMSMKLLVPSVMDQRTCLNAFTCIERHRARLGEVLKKANTLFASLTERAFSGQVTGAVGPC